MIKFKNTFFYFIFIYFVFLNVANAYEISVANKYNDIFDKKIINSSDVENYRKIYLFQEDCKWKKANKYIIKLENNILMGHILAQRYLHPNCYKSKYLELYYWLKKYNDHPQAKRIYRLAIKRMPKGYKSPQKPIKPIGIKEELYNNQNNQKYKSQKKLNKNQKKKKKRINTSYKI